MTNNISIKMSQPKTAKDYILMVAEPLSVGLVAGVATHFLVGDGGEASVLGMPMMPSVAVGVSVAASSLAAGSVQKFALDKVPQVSAIGGLLKPVITGAVSVGVLAALTPFNYDAMLPAFAVGAGSEVGGAWLFGTVINPLLEQPAPKA